MTYKSTRFANLNFVCVIEYTMSFEKANVD